MAPVHRPFVLHDLQSLLSVIISGIHDPSAIEVVVKWSAHNNNNDANCLGERSIQTMKSEVDLPVRLHDDSRSQIFVLVPPVARTRGAAARAQNALVHSVLKPRQFKVFHREAHSWCTVE